MTKKELEQFNEDWEKYLAHTPHTIKSYLQASLEQRERIKKYISQIKVNQRKTIKQDLLKIADRGEYENLRREVEEYFN